MATGSRFTLGEPPSARGETTGSERRVLGSSYSISARRGGGEGGGSSCRTLISLSCRFRTTSTTSPTGSTFLGEKPCGLGSRRGGDMGARGDWVQRW